MHNLTQSLQVNKDRLPTPVIGLVGEGCKAAAQDIKWLQIVMLTCALQ